MGAVVLLRGTGTGTGFDNIGDSVDCDGNVGTNLDGEENVTDDVEDDGDAGDDNVGDDVDAILDIFGTNVNFETSRCLIGITGVEMTGVGKMNDSSNEASSVSLLACIGVSGTKSLFLFCSTLHNSSVTTVSYTHLTLPTKA